MERFFGNNRRKRLGEILVEDGVITPEKIEEALAVQKTMKKGTKLGTVLLDMGYIREQQMADALKNQLGYQGLILQPFVLVRILQSLLMKRFLENIILCLLATVRRIQTF